MYEDLIRRIGYTFKDVNLLKIAMTHRSAGTNHNERFEFLGDSIVNCVIAAELFRRFPRAREGDLSRLRATLVNRDALGGLARSFELGRFLSLGVGEIKSGGSTRSSILSCAMEALIGAVYLDRGFSAVEEIILKWYDNLLTHLPEASSLKDPKTRLQEYLQQQGLSLPVYSVTEREGEVHQQVFTVTCFVGDKKISARGSSRQRAEQAAAAAILEKYFNA